VRPFIEEIFAQTGFPDAAPSIKARVTQAEIAYRHGTAKPTSVDVLVRSVNRIASESGLPSIFRTSHAQIQLQQLFVGSAAPSGLWDEGDDPEMLSPSEATFYTLFLTYQKCFNPTYQLEPDQWAARHRKIMANRPDPAALRIQAKMRPKFNLVRTYTELRTQLHEEKSDATLAAHELFDRLGFGR